MCTSSLSWAHLLLHGHIFPFILALQVADFGKGKIAKFKGKFAILGQILAGWPVGFHFLAFWPFGPSLPFILVFWGLARGQ